MRFRAILYSSINACFASTIFQAKHATPGNSTWGVDGETGKLVDMNTFGVWEPYVVKVQTLKTAIEVSE